jgi:hypothetical protein
MTVGILHFVLSILKCSPLTVFFQSKSSPAASHKPPASKHTPPSRSVFSAAMEDAPSDDESSPAPVVPASLPHNKQPAATIRASASAQQGHSKGQPAASKLQPHSNAKQKPAQAGKSTISSESGAIRESVALKTEAVVSAVEDSGDEGAALAVAADAESSKPSSELAAVPSQSVPVHTENSPTADDESPSATSSDGVGPGAISVTKPAPAAPPLLKLNPHPVTPPTPAADVCVSSALLPATTQESIVLAAPVPIDVPDTVHVDVQHFTVCKRQVDPFCVPEDVPLPPELDELQSSSALTSKIDASETLPITLPASVDEPFSSLRRHCR